MSEAQENVAPAIQPDANVPTFQSKINLALVLGVRDKHGRAIGTLTRDDFRLFDKGVPQAITSFSNFGRTREPELIASETLKTTGSE